MSIYFVYLHNPLTKLSEICKSKMTNLSVHLFDRTCFYLLNVMRSQEGNIIKGKNKSENFVAGLSLVLTLRKI